MLGLTPPLWTVLSLTLTYRITYRLVTGLTPLLQTVLGLTLTYRVLLLPLWTLMAFSVYLWTNRALYLTCKTPLAIILVYIGLSPIY